MSEKYLFITVPNHSGSTWICNVFLHCKNVIGFVSAKRKHNIEGQSLVSNKVYPTDVHLGVPNVWTEKEKNYATIDFEKVKKKWRGEWGKSPKFKKLKTQPKVFLEKSPPNVVHAQRMFEAFGVTAHFLIMVRNPYAFTESVLRSRRSRTFKVDRIVKHWIRCTEIQLDNIAKLPDENRVWFTYEDLVSKPEEIENRIKALIPEVSDLNLNKPARAHSLDGSKRQGLVDYNAKQIARLSSAKIHEITRCLKERSDLLEPFGYELMEVK